jgi:hypothetical protein
MRTFEYRLRPNRRQEQALMQVLIANRKMYDATSSVKGNYFHAPKLCGGRIRLVLHRPMEGTFKFARVVKRPSGWYLQCVCKTEPAPFPKKDNAVGLDMGIRYLGADSHGQIICYDMLRNLKQ